MRFSPGWLAAGLGWVFPLSLCAQNGTNAFSSRPLLIVSGGVAVGTGSNAAATAEPAEPAHLGDPAARSIWWRWTAAATGLAQVDTIGTGFNTRLAVYSGATLGSLQLIGANLGADDAPDFESVVRFQAIAGTSYSLGVDGYTDPADGVTETGSVTLTVRQPAPGTRPANDLFAAAIGLPSSASVLQTGTIVGASVEAGEPDPEAVFVPLGPARSVWYSWRAPSSGVFTLRVEADEVVPWEPVAAVYSGSTLSGLTLLDKAEVLSFAPRASETGLLSATFSATAGQTYRIQVGGLSFYTSEGVFTLSLDGAVRPAQDDFAAAADAGTALAYFGESSLLEATRQTGEPNHFAPIGGSSSLSSATVWWKWTAPASGPVTVDTRGSDGDTVLAVYRAGGAPATLGGLVLVGGNDDINFSFEALGSAHSFTASAGAVYYFAVTGYSQSSRVMFHLATGARRTPYAAWLLGYPSLAGAAAARGADPDGDGLTNLQELLHGTDPTLSSPGRPGEELLLPVLGREGSGLVFECGHANDNLVGLSDGAGEGGIPLLVEAEESSLLTGWTPVPAEDVFLGASFAFVTLPLGPESVRWMRLKVTDPNP